MYWYMLTYGNRQAKAVSVERPRNNEEGKNPEFIGLEDDNEHQRTT